jgi:hypothetical protein
MTSSARMSATLIVEPLEDPVLAATSDAQPVLAATLISSSWCSRW